MSVSGIHGQLLEVTVVACSKLKDTEWISRQDPYVVLEYGSSKFRTRTCTDGHKNPTFQEKFVFTLIEGLRELSVVVWNSNTMRYDDLIGSGKVQLQKVLSQGYDDSSWTLQTKTGRYAGEVRLILHYASSNRPAMNHAYQSPHSAYSGPPPPHSAYSGPPPPHSAYSAPPPYNAYSAPPTSYPPAYPPSAPAYPPATSAYPPPQPTAYPPAPYPPQPTAYPPAPYPPAQSMYPPPPQHGSNPFPGLYPPPHY